MKKIISLILSAGFILGGIHTALADEISDSLIVSLAYDESGGITDTCENLTVDYSASFPNNQTKYPNVYEVKTIDSENGKTNIFHSEYGGMMLTGDMMDEITALTSATFEFWMNFDAEAISSKYNTIWSITEEGSSKNSQEWQFQTQTNGSINARMRMVYTDKEADDNHKWLDPAPNLTGMNGRWAHVVATKERLSDGKWRISAYLDGSLLKTITQKPAKEFTDENTYMRIIDRIESIDVGAVNIYNKALTADEVKTVYDNTKLDYVPLPEEMNLKEISVPGGTEEEPAEINMYEGTVKVTFSNYIYDSTFNSITLADEDGNTVETEISISATDKKSAIVSFGKLDSGVVYKLSIGTGISSVNGYNPEKETVYYYIAIDKREPLEFISYEPEDGVIPIRDGVIKLYFSETVDEETIEESINFKTSDGDDVIGYTLSTDPENKKCILINYPIAKVDGKYTVTVSESLKSNVDMQLEEEVCIELTGENPYLMYNYDFTTYFDEDAAGKAIGKSDIPGLELSADTESQSVGVLDNGDRYLSVIPQKEKNEYPLIARFPEPVTGGDIAVVEAKLRRTGKASYASDMGRVNGDANTNGPNFGEGKIGGTAIDTDEYGFSDVKYMIRLGADGYYYTEVIYYAGGAPVTYTKTYSARAITAINYILMAHLYTTSSPESNGYGDSLDIKSLKIYTAKEVMAEKSNLDGYDTSGTYTINVMLTSAAKASTVSADTIYLREKETGEKVSWKLISYDEDMMCAEFELQDTYLNYGKEYEIVCEGLESTDGIKSKTPFAKTFTTAGYPIRCGADMSLVYKNGVVSFNTSLIRDGSEKLKAVLILYNSDGRIVKVSESDAVWTGTSGNVSVSLTSDNVTNGYYARGYLIDTTNNAFAPITEVPVELLINI